MSFGLGAGDVVVFFTQVATTTILKLKDEDSSRPEYMLAQ
jgi:hypothetical protein